MFIDLILRRKRCMCTFEASEVKNYELLQVDKVDGVQGC